MRESNRSHVWVYQNQGFAFEGRFGSIGIQRESVFPGVVQSQKASVSKILSLLNLYIIWI